MELVGLCSNIASDDCVIKLCGKNLELLIFLLEESFIKEKNFREVSIYVAESYLSNLEFLIDRLLVLLPDLNPGKIVKESENFVEFVNELAEKKSQQISAQACMFLSKFMEDDQTDSL